MTSSAGAVVTMGHGAGGRLGDELISSVFLRHLGNPVLEQLGDSALLTGLGDRTAFTTDGFVVTPRTFPGGDLGTLAVCGTVNDLAVAGAIPAYLSLSVILEEGLPIAELDALVASIAASARAARVQVVTGDTKVVGRGAADGAFFITAGVGRLRPEVPGELPKPQVGDAVLVSGPLGDHGATVLALRSGIDPGAGLKSDCAPVTGLVDALFEAGVRPAFLRDPTRGGLAATLTEAAAALGLQLRIDGEALPVRPEVEAVSDLLGIDVLHLACEGRVVALVPAGQRDLALQRWRALPAGAQAACVGVVSHVQHAGRVIMETGLGGLRVVDRPSAEPLPRIC